jgi:hypothetical protein
LLIRALIAHSARWTKEALDSRLTAAQILHQLGYGIPDHHRAIGNSAYRVTYFSEGEQYLKARQVHIYQIQFPQFLQIDQSTEILVEVTLSYKAQPARTRRGRSEYLSTWLDWDCSKSGETLEQFLQRMLKDSNSTDAIGSNNQPFRWTIGTRKRYAVDTGELLRFSRSAGTLQKDWAYVKLSELGDSFSIAVIGHEGWDTNSEASAAYALVVSLEANPEVNLYDLLMVQEL